jgi:hypothetical protein
VSVCFPEDDSKHDWFIHSFIIRWKFLKRLTLMHAFSFLFYHV